MPELQWFLNEPEVMARLAHYEVTGGIYHPHLAGWSFPGYPSKTQRHQVCLVIPFSRDEPCPFGNQHFTHDGDSQKEVLGSINLRCWYVTPADIHMVCGVDGAHV